MVECYRWFHPRINGLDAEALLRETGHEGSFLVRHSTSRADDYTLSVRSRGDVIHIKIQNKGDYYDLYGGDKFATLSELVKYYMDGRESIKEKNGDPVDLKYPVICEDANTERWFHGHMSGREAEKILMEKGSEGTFLVRSSQSKPGDYVLSVRSGDKVTHIMVSYDEKKKTYGIQKRNYSSLLLMIEEIKKNPLKETTGTAKEIRLKTPCNSTRISASALQNRVKDLEKIEDAQPNAKSKEEFAAEFEQLQQMDLSTQYSKKEGERPENKRRNRYKNILPFDHSRIVLRDGDPTVTGSDYINASLIEVPDVDGKGNRKTYIATQGCLPATLTDFWRMTWQENCRVIVVTTKEVEKGKVKVVRYWACPEDPDGPERVFDGYNCQYIVKYVTERKLSNFVVRELELSKVKNGKTEGPRKIYQFHFLTWPDYGVPGDPGVILSFVESVNRQQESIKGAGPIIVHCSAGIGRTGTYIVIDIILEQIEFYGLDCEIDVQKTIQSTRTFRSGMVQTEGQYKFIYKTLLHFIETEQQRRIAAQSAGDTYGNIESVGIVEKSAKKPVKPPPPGAQKTKNLPAAPSEDQRQVYANFEEVSKPKK
ncbi:hypothetical protein FSP39_004620 [Pinctada imbricata]|uniref:protein-tyrosine-phosphatase n=1 Tax=Pinctada imbricata TaxID=66713 RepID=A0AA89CBV7_PINIB|nr:hypothetical protein FSP39_004620 [Pinctada imbricata]